MNEHGLTPEALAQRLDFWAAHVDAIFVRRLSPEAGLLPASTAKTVHGDYAHAWVRDNVYSVLGMWGLAKALGRHGHRHDLAAQLSGQVTRLMRGLLQAMQAQAQKVERFKHSQDPLDGLHAKYDAQTGAPVVEDDGWGHLQIDATSLFILFLAQMQAGGLSIVQTRDELDFVQNLVHYISPAYRIADYGVWERGRKSNDGVVEINASSVGMAKAALEAIDGQRLLGPDQPAIHVPPDDIARARETLHVLLPAESASKETDAALLSVIGWPAFAIDDKVTIGHTRARILDRLAGRYGCKRFLRDGHQTAMEDEHRLHYHAGELVKFANIESQWPLFFTYLLLEAEMTGDARSSQAWAQRLAPLFQEIDGQALLPELYIVPEEKVAAEIAAPNSQERVPNANVPLLWAQSQWILGALLREGLLDPDDIDPLGRRTPSPPRAHNTIAVSLLAEDDAVKAKLDALGLRCAALAEDDAVKAKLDALGLRCAALSDVQAHCDVRPAGDLVEAWTRIGVNDGLGLSGRPARRLGPLANAILYDSNGRKTVFAPTLLEAQDYHIRYDAAARARRIRGDLRYIARHWRSEVPPVFVLTLDHFAMEGAGADRLLELLVEIDRGQVDFAATHLTTLPECFEAAQKLYPLGHVLAPCLGLPTHPTPQALPAGGLGAALEVAIGAGAADEIEAIYDQAGCAQDWRTARRAAAWLSRTDPRLQDCAKDIVVRLRRLDLGAGQIITRPINETDLIAGLHKAFGEGVEMVLAQEALQALGLFSKGDSTAVRGMQTIRLREILDCVAKHEAGGMDALVAGPPSHLFDAIKALLLETPAVRAIIAPAPQYTLMPSSHVIGGDYRLWRERLGVLTRVGGDFFARLWSLLHVCDGIVFGTNNRLDAAIARSDLTAYERDFALEIEVRLQTIAAPAYRTLCLEALNVLANCHERDKAFGQNGDFVLDDIIHAAVGQLWQDQHGQTPDWTHPQTLWDHALSTTAQTMARTLNQIVTKGILVRAEV